MKTLRSALLISFVICFSLSEIEGTYYNMIFTDDFESMGSLNTSKWSTVTQTMPSRNELQYYTYDNVFVNYNYLYLRAQRKGWNNQQPNSFTNTYLNGFTNGYQQQQQQQQQNGLPTGFQQNGKFQTTWDNRNTGYTSGKVTTKGRFEFLYGTVEVRAKFPKGKGFLSVIQLVDLNKFAPTMSFMAPSTDERQNKLIANYVMDSWMSNSYMRSDEYMYMNNFNYYNNYTREFTQTWVEDMTSEFHVYKIVWDPNFIVWYMDEREVLRVSDPNRIPNRKMAVEMFLSVGNRDYLPTYEQPDYETQFPNYMVVDYVTITQFN